MFLGVFTEGFFWEHGKAVFEITQGNQILRNDTLDSKHISKECHSKSCTWGQSNIEAICIMNKMGFLEKFVILSWFGLTFLVVLSIFNFMQNLLIFHNEPLCKQLLLPVCTIFKWNSKHMNYQSSIDFRVMLRKTWESSLKLQFWTTSIHFKSKVFGIYFIWLPIMLMTTFWNNLLKKSHLQVHSKYLIVMGNVLFHFVISILLTINKSLTFNLKHVHCVQIQNCVIQKILWCSKTWLRLHLEQSISQKFSELLQ